MEELTNFESRRGAFEVHIFIPEELMDQLAEVVSYLSDPTQILGISKAPKKDQEIVAASEAQQKFRERATALAISQFRPVGDCPDFWKRAVHEQPKRRSEQKIHLPDPAKAVPDTSARPYGLGGPTLGIPEELPKPMSASSLSGLGSLFTGGKS
jgi:hypothetical protein